MKAGEAILILDRQETMEQAAEIVKALLPLVLESVSREGWAISVLLTDAVGIQEYNRQYRQKAHPTDVLAFRGDGEDDDGRPYLGDLIVSVEQAAEQGPEYGNSAEEELQVLVIHGVLHLLGMDHETDEGEMEARERELRKALLGEEIG